MSLKEKIFLLLIAFGITPLLIFSFVFIRASEKEALDDTGHDLSFVASLVETNVQAIFDADRERVVDWTSDGHIKKETSLLVSGLSRRETEERARKLAEYIKKWKLSLDSSVYETEIIDRNGAILVTTLPEYATEPEDFLLEDIKELFGSRAGETRIINGFARHPDSSVFTLHVASPIVDLETGEVTAVMVNHVLGDALNSYLESTEKLSHERFQEIGKTFKLYLVDTDKTLLTKTGSGEAKKFETKIDTLPVRTCVTDGTGISSAWDDYRGIRVFGASRCRDKRWWMVVAEANESELLANVHRLRQQAFLVLLGVAISLILVIFLLMKSFAKMMREEVATIKSIANGEFSLRLPVSGRDEISQLNKHVNDMAQKLISYLKEARLARTEAEKQKKLAEQKVRELEKFTKLTVGRELKMAELKEKLKKGGKDKKTSPPKKTS